MGDIGGTSKPLDLRDLKPEINSNVVVPVYQGGEGGG